MLSSCLKMAVAGMRRRAEEEARLSNPNPAPNPNPNHNDAVHIVQMRLAVLQIAKRNDQAVVKRLRRDAQTECSAGGTDGGTNTDEPDDLVQRIFAAFAAKDDARFSLASVPWERGPLKLRGCNFCHSLHGGAWCGMEQQVCAVTAAVLQSVGDGWRGVEQLVRTVFGGSDEAEMRRICRAVVTTAARPDDEQLAGRADFWQDTDPNKLWCGHCRRRVSEGRHWGTAKLCPVRALSMMAAAVLGPVTETSALDACEAPVPVALGNRQDVTSDRHVAAHPNKRRNRKRRQFDESRPKMATETKTKRARTDPLAEAVAGFLGACASLQAIMRICNSPAEAVEGLPAAPPTWEQTKLAQSFARQ